MGFTKLTPKQKRYDEENRVRRKQARQDLLHPELKEKRLQQERLAKQKRIAEKQERLRCEKIRKDKRDLQKYVEEKRRMRTLQDKYLTPNEWVD